MTFYIPIIYKFFLSLIAAIIWASFSLSIAEQWFFDMTDVLGASVAMNIIFGVAILPGAMNAFLVSSLLTDFRPSRKQISEYPPISILIAAYNESESILSTLESIDKQRYPDAIQVIVINDGSTDDTVDKIKSVNYPWLTFLNLPNNVGKANALNEGLKLVTSDITITIDGDSYLYKNALIHIVERYLSDPAHTAAIAGAVLVRNSREKFVTKVQEWDYFHGIAAIKRIQSLYQGTLVAQGAFSLYKTEVLREVNGWPPVVGEDIVLTWAILNKGYRVGFAENACLFTNAPNTWIQFFKQRQRWSRGLLEAFKSYWMLLFKPKLITLFIWWNLLFPYLDIVYTLTFIPGLILALFGIYWIAGPMTLVVLPLAMIVNYLMFNIQNKMFREQGLKVRKNLFGFIFYAMFYSIILQPACVVGYIKEICFGKIKNWGTK